MTLKNKLITKAADWFSEGVVKSLITGKENLRFKLAKREINRRFDMAEEQGSKKWYQSRTMIVNALTIIAGGLTFLASPDAKMDAQQAGTIAGILGVVNMLLRLATDKPVGK